MGDKADVRQSTLEVMVLKTQSTAILERFLSSRVQA